MVGDYCIDANKQILVACADYFKRRFEFDPTSPDVSLDPTVPARVYEELFCRLLPIPLGKCFSPHINDDFESVCSLCFACDQMYVAEDDSIAVALKMASERVMEMLSPDNVLQAIVLFKDISTNTKYTQAISDKATQLALKIPFESPAWAEFEANHSAQAINVLKRKRDAK